VRSKQLVWWATVIKIEKYKEAELKIKEAIHERKQNHLKKSFLEYAALHRAYCLSGDKVTEKQLMFLKLLIN
jgi:hypothetical protein